MITSRQRILWASLLASAAFAVSAQTPLPSDTPLSKPAATAEHAPHKAHDGKPAERLQERRAKRLDALKDQLKLNASQQGAWDNFAAATQPPVRTAQQRPDRAEFEKMTTPQRLDRMEASQSERAATFAKRNDATRKLYAALTPEQQKTFDAKTLQRGARGMHGAHGQHGPQGHRPGVEKPSRS